MTRQAVVHAAATTFDEVGYLAARLDDIVAQTGMTKGAVYFHFRSKDDLAATLVRAQFESWPAVVAKTEQAAADGLDHLVRLSREVARVLTDDVEVRAGARLAVERRLIDPGLPEPFAWWADLLAPVARRARRDGSLARQVAPAALARVVACYLLGAEQLSDRGRPTELRRRVEEFWTLALPALRAVSH